VRKEDLKASFDQIKPSEYTKKRMLDNILNHSDRKKGIFMSLFKFKKAIPALALVVVIVGGLLTYDMLQKNNNYDSLPEYSVSDSAGSGGEDLAAPLLNQFQIDKLYVLLSDDLREEYGFPVTVNESDIGEKITDIATSPDKSLIGSEVYRYIPAGGEAVVAVKKDNEYQLFRFFVFESYNNNQDEDSVRYLELYGIDSADDIAKIQFIGHSEQSKLEGRIDILGEITDRDEIAQFYNYYSALKNSSDKYFDKLFNYRETDSGNKGIEVDTVEPDIAAPDIAGSVNVASPPVAEPDLVSPDNIVSPDTVESDMIAPDQIGYGEDQPTGVASVQAHVAEDAPLMITDGMMDMGDTGSGSTEPSRGSVEPSQGSTGEALANPITIRIYNQSGVYYDSVYYINLGFISRYEVSEDFADFIGRYLGK